MSSPHIRTILWVCAMLGLAPSPGGATIEVMPLVGFQINGAKDLAGPRYDRLDLRNTALRGFSIGYINSENGELEFSWTRAYSAAQIQRTEGLPSDRFDVRIDQLHLNAIFMWEPASFQPFMLVGLGATRYTPSTSRSATTKFSLALGGGVKWFWNDHFGLRLDARWTPVVVLPGSHFFCDETGSSECYTTETPSFLGRRFPLMGSIDFISGLLLRY